MVDIAPDGTSLSPQRQEGFSLFHQALSLQNGEVSCLLTLNELPGPAQETSEKWLMHLNTGR